MINITRIVKSALWAKTVSLQREIDAVQGRTMADCVKVARLQNDLAEVNVILDAVADGDSILLGKPTE
jgi:hypothetical protein